MQSHPNDDPSPRLQTVPWSTVLWGRQVPEGHPGAASRVTAPTTDNKREGSGCHSDAREGRSPRNKGEGAARHAQEAKGAGSGLAEHCRDGCESPKGGCGRGTGQDGVRRLCEVRRAHP